MNLTQFIATRPCIEEMEGYRKALLGSADWTDEDQVMYLTALDDLKQGRVQPAPSRMERGYTYKAGKKPKRIWRKAE